MSGVSPTVEGPSTSVLGPSILAGVLSVCAVGLLTGCGVVLYRYKVVNEDGAKMLSKLNLNCLLPCLIFVKLSNTSIHTVWNGRALPLCVFIYILIGFIIAWVVRLLVPIPQKFRNGFVVGSAFGNGTSMPIVVTTTLVTAYSAFAKYGEKEVVTLCSLSLPVQHSLMWLLGYNYIKAQAHNNEEQELLPTVITNKTGDSSEGKFSSFLREIRESLSQLVNPPLIAVLLGMILLLSRDGLSQYIKLSPTSTDWLVHALTEIGNASIPLSMIVVGITLARTPTCPGLKATIASMIVIRMLIMPLVGLVTANIFTKIGLLNKSDPLISIVVMSLSCMPTANNINTMCSALGAGHKEMATCAFWQMLIFPITLLVYIPLWISLS